MIRRVRSAENPELPIWGDLPCRRDPHALAQERVELLQHHDLLGSHLLRRPNTKIAR